MGIRHTQQCRIIAYNNDGVKNLDDKESNKLKEKLKTKLGDGVATITDSKISEEELYNSRCPSPQVRILLATIYLDKYYTPSSPRKYVSEDAVELPHYIDELGVRVSGILD